MAPGRIVPFPRADLSSRGPAARALHELFEKRVDERPEAPAVVAGRETTSYAGLERYANRLARHLWARGVRRGSRVGILLPHSVDAYAAMLGVLKAGAACVPIDPHLTAERTTYMLGDCGAAALVTTTELVHRHAGFQGSVIQLDLRRAAIAAEDHARLPPDMVRVGPSDLCCVFYLTDGADQPRGVMVEHGSALHLARTAGCIFGVRPWDRVYQGSSLSRAVSFQETWLALQAGAALVPRMPGTERAGGSLARLLAGARVTVLSCTPGFLSALAHDVPPLRLVILGGGRCPDDLVARWGRADRRLVNTYGHTETTMIATYADLLPGRPVNAGRPLPGCRVYVLDDRLRLVRYGRIGEICIGGAGVARGYLGRPADTCARFVSDPFAPPAMGRARVYLTGELGRIDASGNLELHGRAAWARAEAPSLDGSRA